MSPSPDVPIIGMRGFTEDTMSKQKHVLIVDDDSDCRSILKKILSEGGYDVAQCSNGLEALDYVRGRQPDVMILDIMMPRMSGYDVASHLKQNEGTANIPIILLSAKGSTEDVMKGYNECSVNYYISKPFSAKQILTGIEMVLDDDDDEKPHISCIKKKRSFFSRG